jgi:GDP-mannose transporter
MKVSAITRADMASLVVPQVAPLTLNKRKLDEFTMVLYNNVLSLPMLLLAAGINGEFATILAEPALRNTRFQAAACLSAICGFLISFCSLWFLSTTTATTYSLVGSLNKMPIAVLGLLFFDSSWDAKNLASIAVGLAAGVVFVRAKQSSS